MTPAPTPAPDEKYNSTYLISWEELRDIYVHGLSLDKYDVIRSRPAPPAAIRYFASDVTSAYIKGQKEGTKSERERVLALPHILSVKYGDLIRVKDIESLRAQPEEH